MRLKPLLALGALCASLPAMGQIIPKDAAVPVEVHKPKGDFAGKLNGAVMPAGKGWKAAVDNQKRLQLMVPETWKVEADPAGEAVLRVVPGDPKTSRAALMVILATPRDDDPLEVDEDLAEGYAEGAADLPELKRAQFQLTDSGFVMARDLKFALVGGTMVQGTKKQRETFRQAQLIYVSEDRVVSIQFAAPQDEFGRYADQVARIFASYQNLGVVKTEQ